jgi:hypothetical protein
MRASRQRLMLCRASEELKPRPSPWNGATELFNVGPEDFAGPLLTRRNL